ncbi:MAG: dethiobiotin synthase [Desulforhopalus sp.]
MKYQVYFVSGIDTGIGKTIATGLLARSCQENGFKTITQKIVQTGCVGISEDIVRHRQIMGIDLQSQDAEGLTCPYVFPVPCSPHLAARLENTKIDCDVIRSATASLLTQFDCVFLEGAGGLFVPLNEEETLIDYIEAEQHPLILVSSSRLGSINHTLSALALARQRNIEVAGIIYNRFEKTDQRIEEDSREVFTRYMKKNRFSGPVIDLFPLQKYQNYEEKLNISGICS